MLINIIIILLLAGSFFIGLKQGFISKFIRLTSFILSLFAGFYFYQPIAEWLRTWLPYPSALGAAFEGLFYTVIGFLLIFLVTTMIVASLGRILQMFASLPILRTVNKALGGIFGVVKTYVIILLLLIGISFFPIDSLHVLVNESTIAMTMLENTPIVSDLHSFS
ncbi:Uncharacterized membrane protein, required for colicin V production [Alteribacillus persepolensis]|uniref:Uncharacterized membrane protein, required for colicin V production n=1 Tax=Alteribacillus persepolensis TaxID=568899 RepID=A0A1G8KAS1_9BACI|nr:CvpA family protein [Alteribacillus persepolensis]SDI40487.1 Uncharacterized membrane protein, required for colicin V production [Alteribacillus persepolensis]